jgi:hypothetical protein
LFSVSIEERERNLIGFEPLSLATIRPGFANSDFATHGENDSFVLIESRLTENDFQSARKEVLLVYRDFCDVFEGENLPRTEGRLQSYQLLRNALAAYVSAALLLRSSRREEGWRLKPGRK